MEQYKPFNSHSKVKNLKITDTYGWDIPIKQGALNYEYYEEINRRISQDIYSKIKAKVSTTKPVSSFP